MGDVPESGLEYFLQAGTVTSPRQAVDGRYACPCCGALTLSQAGYWEICPTCRWEDDPVQEKHPELAGGANKLSLVQARAAYRQSQETR